jgi:hypothetical protein
MLAETSDDLDSLPPGPLDGAAIERFASAVRRRIAPRNVAGLADPARNRLFPVDFEALIESASLLGLSAAELGERLPRLRGDPVGAAPRELSADQGRQAQNALLGQQKE